MTARDPNTPPATRRTVEVVTSDPAWPAIASRLAAAIEAACGDAVLRVEHIGSTSVPGLAAKPVIDLMPVLATFQDGAHCIAPMARLGYEYRGEYGIRGRHYFTGVDAGSSLRVHAHALVEGSEECRNHLRFRDYLRAHPSEAAAYAALKQRLAAGLREDREAYTEAKAPWVRACLERAAGWAEGRAG